MARKKGGLRFSDTQLLSIVSEERKNSVGFENDTELANDRNRALEYAKGEMKDVKALKNRSAVVDTAISDAIETVMPDLMEIFTGGEDIVAFTPKGEEDIEGAAQETDYLNHVAFQQNNGFLNFYTAFKDALLVKTGVWKFWWEEYEETEEEKYANKTADQLGYAKTLEGVEVDNIEEVQPDYLADGVAAPAEKLYNFTVRRTVERGCAKYEAIPPEDFTVGRDTVWLQKATYCAYRTHPRVQDLIAGGYDPVKVRALPEAHSTDDETTDKARDTAGENDEKPGSDNPDLKTVEIVEHFLRIDLNGDDKPELWRIVTGADESVLLEKEERSQIEFAAITPYLNAHRFYGVSLADKLVEVQRIKTALKRLMLDSGYFALNQRNEVNEDRSTTNTITDLLRNEPGVPVRSKGDAIKPILSGGINFDVAGALEYFETVGESATGVVRNAQGLNPDTLHDTAKGAMALMAASQRRVRMIARIFAETGVKDLFLGIHALVRQNATSEEMVRLRGKFVPVDPTKWGNRKDMTIEVGVGSGGKEMELAIIGQVLAFQEKIIAMQGGLAGPLVTGENVYKALTRFAERGGIKAPENYFTDPETVEAPEEKPDPAVAQAQQELELEREKAAQQLELQRQEAEEKARLAREEMVFEQSQAQQRAQFEAQLAMQKAEFEAALATKKAEQEAQRKANLPDNRPGGSLAA